MSSVISMSVSPEEERKTSDVSVSLPKRPSLRTSSTERMPYGNAILRGPGLFRFSKVVTPMWSNTP